MSTIAELVSRDELRKIKVELRSHQTPERTIFAMPRAIDWMQSTLKKVRTDAYDPTAISPTAQLAVLCSKFISGADLDPPLPHEMRPDGNGIWEIRTVHLRLFGFFPQRCTFVITDIDSKANCLGPPSLYPEYLKRGHAARVALDINGGTFVTGELSDVL